MKPVKAKRTVQARVEPDPVETIPIKVKPAKAKPVWEPTPDAPPVDPNWARAMNWKQSNAYPTLKEWYAKFGREE